MTNEDSAWGRGYRCSQKNYCAICEDMKPVVRGGKGHKKYGGEVVGGCGDDSGGTRSVYARVVG